MNLEKKPIYLRMLINKCQFLCGGQIFSVKTNGTVKENKLKKDTPIVLVKDIE